MLDANTIQILKVLSKDFTVLYVEDNEGLREKALTLMNKLMHNVYSASDGQEGFEKFKELYPDIVITDLNMPKLDGMSMLKKMKKVSNSTKFIITSAFDDKEYLLKAIDIGVFRYMKKPVKIDILAQALIECIREINKDKNLSIFDNYANDMVNYQSDILALLQGREALYVNKMFLNFFDIDTLDDFYEKYDDFGEVLLEHKGFLYQSDSTDWFNDAIAEQDKLFHVKLNDKDNNKKHFVLKMHPIPKKEDMYILSLNDITELNLLSLFDSKATQKDAKVKNIDTILNLVKAANKNKAEMKMHNFYKGLCITTPGLIVDVNDDSFVLQATLLQEKAAQIEKNLLISSDLFPSVIQCDTVDKIDFENQTITVKDFYFVDSNPTRRKSVRVQPEEKHTISLFIDERKFYVDLNIHDISIEAVNLKTPALPAGLMVGDEVFVNIVLEHYKKQLIINSKANVFRIQEYGRNYYLVLMFIQEATNKNNLSQYIARRQMSLVSEFKGMRFG